MVRNYKRLTDRHNISEENVANALRDVLKYQKSIRETASKYNLTKSMLHKRIKRYKANNSSNNDNDNNSSDSGNMSEDDGVYKSLKVEGRNKYRGLQIFSDEQEKLLCKYLIKASAIHYGLSYVQTRKLAFEYAVHLGVTIPGSWLKNKTAGVEWMSSLMKRNPELSLRKPENTSLARATAFNSTNVNRFFDNYERVMSRYKFTPDRILNLDETGISTVLTSPKIIAETGKKQVGQIVSRERGELVTMCGIIKATGSALPPVFIFPRVRYQDHFLTGAPVGSLGLASKSGWMSADLFPAVLKHIQQHTLSSKETPFLLLLDNHSSHISIEAVTYAKENGLVLLSFPPHCSHRMQPLDVAVYGPFKGALKTAFSDWMRTNPAKIITIYNIPALAATAFMNAFTPKNITSGFAKPGIYPPHRLAFTKEDFLCNYVTDKPDPAKTSTASASTSTMATDNLPQTPEVNELYPKFILTLPSSPPTHRSPPRTPEANGTPEFVRPLPKVSRTQKETTRKRLKGQSRVYTNTPEKNRLEELSSMKKENVKRKICKKPKKNGKSVDQDVNYNSSSSESRDEALDLSSDSDDNGRDVDLPEPPILCDSDVINFQDFLLVKFEVKKKTICYVGQVIDEYDGNDYEVKFMRKKRRNFVFPAIDDVATVQRNDIVCKLPPPNIIEATKRLAGYMSFDIDFSMYDVL